MTATSLDAAQRILVIGAEAAGKTTLARRLAAARGIACVHLDEIAWQSARAPERDLSGQFEPGYTSSEPLVVRPRADRLAAIDEIAAGPDWVAEGVFLAWTEALFAAADVIVWLDHVPLSTALRRVLGRHVRSVRRNVRALRSRPLGDKARTIATGARRLAGTLRRIIRFHVSRRSTLPDPDDYRGITRRAMRSAASAHREKVLHVRSSADLARLTRSLRSEPSSRPMAPR